MRLLCRRWCCFSYSSFASSLLCAPYKLCNGYYCLRREDVKRNKKKLCITTESDRLHQRLLQLSSSLNVSSSIIYFRIGRNSTKKTGTSAAEMNELYGGNKRRPVKRRWSETQNVQQKTVTAHAVNDSCDYQFRIRLDTKIVWKTKLFFSLSSDSRTLSFRIIAYAARVIIRNSIFEWIDHKCGELRSLSRTNDRLQTTLGQNTIHLKTFQQFSLEHKSTRLEWPRRMFVCVCVFVSVSVPVAIYRFFLYLLLRLQYADNWFFRLSYSFTINTYTRETQDKAAAGAAVAAAAEFFSIFFSF